jgi:hypothetical protein
VTSAVACVVAGVDVVEVEEGGGVVVGASAVGAHATEAIVNARAGRKARIRSP